MPDRAMMALMALALAGGELPSPAAAQPIEPPGSAAPMSQPAVQVANWATASGDNRRLAFIVIDKVDAAVFVFGADGQLIGTTPALLGVAVGDHTAPGVGDRKLSAIRPDERTTPAGRFLAQFGPAVGHRKVLWVDYAASIALHPLVTANTKERRQQRLQSPSAKDNRITYGCINISATFFENVVRKLLGKTGGVVYILPETKPLTDVFPTFRVQQQPGLPAAIGR